MLFFGFSLRLLPLSLLRVKRPWCIYLFLSKGYFSLDICSWGCEFHFYLFYVRGDWALFFPPPPPPPPLVQYTVHTHMLRFFIFIFLQWRERGGIVRGTIYSYCRSQLIYPPPSPFSHYGQLLPLTVGVSPPSHFPLYFYQFLPSPLPICMVQTVRSYFVARG